MALGEVHERWRPPRELGGVGSDDWDFDISRGGG